MAGRKLINAKSETMRTLHGFFDWKAVRAENRPSSSP
jgi:hypothetical protein